MATVTYKQLRDALVDAGFKGIQIPVMIAIAMAESGLNTDALGDSGQSFGLFQIYQPVWGHKFGPACATDIACSAKAAYEISNGGKDYNPWSVFRFSRFGREYDPNYANPFTKFLPDVLKSFGIPVDIDIAAELKKHGASLPDIIEDVGEDIVDGVTPDIPDWVTDPTSLLPSIDDVKSALVVVSLLGIGMTFIALGTYGLVTKTDAGKAAVTAGTAVATRGASLAK